MAQNLKRPEFISGYEHPTQEQGNYSSTQTIYKTFTEGKRPKKNESFNSTKTHKRYSIIQANITTCPICNEEPIHICPCSHSDKKCNNNHIWYLDRDGKIINGNPHKQ